MSEILSACSFQTGVTPVSAGVSPFERMRKTLHDIELLLALAQHDSSTDQISEKLKELQHAADGVATLHERALARAQFLSTVQVGTRLRSNELSSAFQTLQNELRQIREDLNREKTDRMQFLTKAFENSREGVVILDAQARILNTNPAFRRIVDRPDRTIEGQPLHLTVDWAFPGYHAVLKNVQRGQPWSGRVIINRGGTEERAYLLSLSPVENTESPSNIIVLLSDVTEIDKTQKRLKRQALHDQLTGLPNRRFYRERLRNLIDESRQKQQQFAVCFVDLDDFKIVNDSMGHSAGDELLVQIGQKLRQTAGEDSFVARFGGDEFAVLIPRTDEDPRLVATVTDDILRTLREPIPIRGTEVRVSASFGISIYPTDGETADELMQNADVAMYAAKHEGSSQIRMFNPVMRHKVERRNRIQRELHNALQGNDIFVQFQPLVDLRSGQLASCEALARWKTPGGDLISPAEFIPVAEQTGLVNHLGEVILSRVCRQLVDWDRRGIRPARTSINLSSRQFRCEGFSRRVRDLLDREGANPEWFTLEVTETAIMDDISAGILLLDELARLGFSIALDDFGTGHSSLSYLRSLNVHFLKIDRSFVTDLPGDDRAFAIVDSVIRMGQSRGLKIVAEGIETQAQFDSLCDMGCDVGQGYLISHPLSPEAFEEWNRWFRNSLPRTWASAEAGTV